MDASRYLQPRLRAEVAYAKTAPVGYVPPAVRPTYPPLGTNPRADVAPPGAQPPLPVSGPSMPQCGSRLDKGAKPFANLSFEVASCKGSNTSPKSLVPCWLTRNASAGRPHRWQHTTTTGRRRS